MTAAEYPDFPSDFGHWFAGFVDGEGNFDIHPVGRSFICRFSIGLRVDDTPIMREIHQRLGLGRVSFIQGQGNTGGQVRWMVDRKHEAALLVRAFETYPLRAKKAGDFIVWRQAVAQWQTVRTRRRHDWTAMALLREQLRQGRRVDAVSMALAVPSPDPQLSMG